MSDEQSSADGEELGQWLDVVKRAVNRSDPCGWIAKGADDDAYIAEVTEIARRLSAGEMLVPALVAGVFRSRGHCVDPDDIREITRQIGAGLGFA